jgi:hypothetical protein
VVAAVKSLATLSTAARHLPAPHLLAHVTDSPPKVEVPHAAGFAHERRQQLPRHPLADSAAALVPQLTAHAGLQAQARHVQRSLRQRRALSHKLQQCAVPLPPVTHAAATHAARPGMPQQLVAMQPIQVQRALAQLLLLWVVQRLL